jgi:hypothetical protein
MTARWRTTLAFVALLASIAGIDHASARVAAGPAVQLRVQPPTIYYRQPRPNATNVAGRLSSGRRGVTVILGVRRWPFHGSFKAVRSELTGRMGRFNFIERPSSATEFQVSSPASTSRTETVYLYPGYENASCTWSGPQGQGSCSHAPTKPGAYTMHFGFDYVYPVAARSGESRLPVFVYFAECFGCTAIPTTLHRQGTVSQHRTGPNNAQVSISQAFSVRAGQKYRWYLAPCVQSTERSNGFGLPGGAGAHHCGSASVASRYFLHGRDLG